MAESAAAKEAREREEKRRGAGNGETGGKRRTGERMG